MLLEPPVTELLILRYDLKLTADGVMGKNREQPEKRGSHSTTASNCHLLLVFRGRGHRWKDLSEGPDTKKTLPAGIATVGRKMQQAFDEKHGSVLHALAGNMIQVKISAPRAVGETGKRQGHAPGIKPSIARVTSPWTAPGKRKGEIQHSGSMRAETIRAAALRADHKLLTSLMCDRITKSLPVGNTSEVLCCYASV